MKKTVKFILAIAVVAMTVASCQKEGQFNPSKKISRQTITTTENGETTISRLEYQWDGNKLKQTQYYSDNQIGGIVSYTYDKKNRISQIEYVNTSYPEYPETAKYTYNGNVLEKIDYYRWSTDEGKDILIETRTFTHDGKKISKIEVSLHSIFSKSLSTTLDNASLFFFPDEIATTIAKDEKSAAIKGELYKTYQFTWEKDNISKMEIARNGYKTTYSYTYDNGKNPLYGLFDSFSTSDYDDVLSKNNILTINGSRVEDNVTVTMKPINYTYDYDGKYPTSKSCTIQYTDEYGQDVTQTKTYHFEY